MKEDRELVADALASGAEAFRSIVEGYQHAVFGIAWARLGDFHHAQDVVQQVFVEAFQRLDSLRDPARLGAWLRSMTVHCCIDLWRRQAVSAAVLLHLEVEEQRKRRDFVPALVPLLRDPTPRVRKRAASELRPWAADIPLTAAALALAEEEDAAARGAMTRLVQAIVAAQAQKGDPQTEPPGRSNRPR